MLASSPLLWMLVKLRGSCCSRLIIVGCRVCYCFPLLWAWGFLPFLLTIQGGLLFSRLYGVAVCSPLCIGCKLLPLLSFGCRLAVAVPAAAAWLWCSVLSGAASVGCCGWCCCLEFGRAVLPCCPFSGAVGLSCCVGCVAVLLLFAGLCGCSVLSGARGCGCVVLSGAAVVLLAVRWPLLLVGCKTTSVYGRGLLSWRVWWCCCAAYLLPLVAWAVVLVSGAVAVATSAVLSVLCWCRVINSRKRKKIVRKKIIHN